MSLWKNTAPQWLALYIIVLAGASLATAVRTLEWWYQLLFAACAIVSLFCLYLTTTTDPGILPPCSSPDPLIEQLEQGSTEPQELEGSYSRGHDGMWLRLVSSGGKQVAQKYCPSCHIWRPPRSHHCSICGHCMERFDHHCGVVDNCIAKFNHRWFAAFLMAAQAACIISTVGASRRLQQLQFPDEECWRNGEVYVLMAAGVVYGYHALALLFGTGHCLMVTCDVTTKDLMRNSRELRRNMPCMPGGYRAPALLAQSCWRLWCAVPLRGRAAGGQQALLLQQQQQQEEFKYDV